MKNISEGVSTYIAMGILPDIADDEVAFISVVDTGEEYLIVNGQLKKIADTSNFATKQEISNFATKTEISSLADREELEDKVDYSDLPEPTGGLSDALEIAIDAKIAEAISGLATKEEVAPLSEAQITAMTTEIINNIINDGSGNLTINYIYDTPTAKIVTPLNQELLQDDFVDMGNGTYQYKFDPATYGDGEYTIEICMA